MYTIGIEEEFFVFDARTRRAVRRADRGFFERARKAIGDRVMTEMLQSQIEVATPPCATMAEARTHLVRYRGALAEAADARSLGIAAMGTFPLAFWPEQEMTPKERYGAIMEDLQMIGARNMLCGMHVHVAVAARASATHASTPRSTASAAPSRPRTSGTRSVTASPPPSSIRSAAPRSTSRAGSPRCATWSRWTLPRSAAPTRWRISTGSWPGE